MPHSIGEIIIKSILRKAENSYTRRTEPFILEQDSETIKNWVEKHAAKIIEESICGNEIPDLLALYNAKDKNMNIYGMKEILEQMNRMLKVEITKRGIIKLNKYFTIQRKGGNGGHEKHSKDHIDHGGNNIQVKINTASFAKDIKPLCSYKV